MKWFLTALCLVVAIGQMTIMPAKAAVGSASIPANFHGQITYDGNFSESYSPAVKQSTTGGGALVITLQFNGDKVTGSYTVAGGNGHGTLTGTRNGDHCVLREDNVYWGVLFWDATCNQGALAGTYVTAKGASTTIKGQVNAEYKTVIDFNEQARQQAVAQAEAAKSSNVTPPHVTNPSPTQDAGDFTVTLAPGWQKGDSRVQSETGGVMTNFFNVNDDFPKCWSGYVKGDSLNGLNQNELNKTLYQGTAVNTWSRLTAGFQEELPGLVVSERDISSDFLSGVKRSFFKKSFQNAHGLSLIFEGVWFKSGGAGTSFICIYDGHVPGVSLMIRSVRPRN